jgi:zinc-ribbon domain
MLVGVVLLLWSSVGRLTGESPLTLEEAIGLGAPSPEEERKQSILRALKDLDYERGVGKISDEDFAELSARYRADAKALLKLIDAESAPFRKSAEERLAARLRQEKTAAGKTARKRKRTKPDDVAKGDARPAVVPAEAADASDTVEAVADKAPEPAPSSGRAPGFTCPSCQTTNDPDAVFCKRCGSSLGRAAGGAS